MLTIPKLIDPLQIALAMLVPPSANGARVRYPTQERRIPNFRTPLAVFSTPGRRYPQDYQHNLLINKDLRRWIILPWRRRLLWDESHANYGFNAPGVLLPAESVARSAEPGLGTSSVEESMPVGAGSTAGAPLSTAEVPPKLGALTRT
jgi:hypothetical protein